MASKGNKCMFFNCGKSKRTHGHLKLFRFPKDQIRAKEWVKQSGNIKLADLTDEQLNNRHVCSLHFQPSDFNNVNTQQRLKSTAIPLKYDTYEFMLPVNPSENITNFESPDLHVKTPTKTYNKMPKRTPIDSPHLPAVLNRSSSSINLSDECSPSTSSLVKAFIDMPSPVSNNKHLNKSGVILFPEEPCAETSNNKLIEVIRKKNALLKNKSSTICKLRKKFRSTQKLKSNIPFSSVGSKVIAEMQMFRKRNSKLPWKLSEKNFAINLYYKSPTTYKVINFLEKNSK